MQELGLREVAIEDRFWSPRLETNAVRAVHHQWEQLEATGCIDNFRVAAGDKEGFREGWFFADSDAYKWLDAACRIATTRPSPLLSERIETLVGLLARAQEPGGYLYTYNQLHFPGQRWVNLQIEHELYCLGHLVEACVSYDDMREGTERFDRPPSRNERGGGMGIARRAADLLVRELMEAGPEHTDGHEEIEIALVRLYRRTGEASYLELARRLVERRGRIPHWAGLIRRQETSRRARQLQVEAQRASYVALHPEHAGFRLPPDNVSKSVLLGRQRRLLSALSGKMLQQHRPMRETRVPVGHAVRFCYLATAAAMLAREGGDPGLQAALEATWERMVRRRMYVTGGLGALPAIEGFGRDYELDPEASYSETCAALGSLFWNWEMVLLTGEARYADLFEWQMYNAVSVGMGLDGRSYLYNNPLACRMGIERRTWFAVPCCPSNLSRTWAAIGRYLVSAVEEANEPGPGSAKGYDLWVHQYVGCRAQAAPGVELRVASELPWEGRVRIDVEVHTAAVWTLQVRIPSWTRGWAVQVNGEAWEPRPVVRRTPVSTASGYAPHGAFYLPLRRRWAAGDSVTLELPMPIVVRRTSCLVHGSHGRASITRGPLVYCLESVDNPELDLFGERVDPESLRAEVAGAGEAEENWAGMGVSPTLLRGQTAAGKPVTLIPYFAWANRGPSQMNVMVRV
ncbi:MAG TPA: glycoside hydrolase family 127 protein [Anaerolineae bacterium]|nr:glycoside hydrolase family 127 protein [Anaerolineae bacterium]